MLTCKHDFLTNELSKFTAFKTNLGQMCSWPLKLTIVEYQ